MKRRLYILIFYLFLHVISFGQAPKCIWFYKPYTDTIETNLYTDTFAKFDYNLQYDNVKNANASNDLKNAIKHNDLRFISISGYSYLFPGLEGGYETGNDGKKVFNSLKDEYLPYLDKYSFKVIEGTSDVNKADNPPLQNVAYNYAKKYNRMLLKMVIN